MKLDIEQIYWKQNYPFVIGIDEVGRGPLAGPVCSCAVLIRPNYPLPNKFVALVKDSKKLSPQIRQKIYEQAINLPQIIFSISMIDNQTIDTIGIQKSIFQCFDKCISQIINKSKIIPNIILIDGNQTIPHLPYNQKPIIKGDDKIFSIALASVIAKHTRDTWMIQISTKYPKYNFDIHKGYGTEQHKKLIKKYGPCSLHRQSFLH